MRSQLFLFNQNSEACCISDCVCSVNSSVVGGWMGEKWWKIMLGPGDGFVAHKNCEGLPFVETSFLVECFLCCVFFASDHCFPGSRITHLPSNTVITTYKELASVTWEILNWILQFWNLIKQKNYASYKKTGCTAKQSWPSTNTGWQRSNTGWAVLAWEKPSEGSGGVHW